MAGYPPARRDTGVIGSIEDWMDQRNADVRKLSHGAEIAGRTAWDKATRTGQNLLAATPHDVVALGARILGQGSPQVSKPGQPARPPVAMRGSPRQQQVPAALAKPFAQEAMDQVLAGARGAQDAFTFGGGDHAYAAQWLSWMPRMAPISDKHTIEEWRWNARGISTTPGIIELQGSPVR